MAKDKKESKKSKRAEGDGPARLTTKHYEQELTRLQGELQYWVPAEGARIIVVFEGRDAAGKGEVIKRITQRLSPRVFSVVALPAPMDRDKTQLYMQRYIACFPAAGEIILFDVERVMGFFTKQECERFLRIGNIDHLFGGQQSLHTGVGTCGRRSPAFPNRL